MSEFGRSNPNEDDPEPKASSPSRSPAIEVSQAIDPKGRIVLERFGRDALLFRGGKYQPFVVAHGYDEKTGEWSHGNYLDTVSEAVEKLNPKAARSARNSTHRHWEPGR